MLVALPPFGQVVTQEVVWHGPGECEGWCPYHKPSKHHMMDWPMCMRLDRTVPLVERICAHGIGHPDPDSLAWAKHYKEIDYSSHGCDGCCGAMGMPPALPEGTS